MMPALVNVGSLFAQQAGARAIQERAPRNIADAFYLDSPKRMGATFYIDVHIDLRTAPAAAAYEWGSGIHATRGNAEEYPIPVEATGVAFPKERWPKYNPPPGKPIPDYFFFDQIMHPGVAPRPYIAPTLRDHIQEYANMLLGALKAEIFAGQDKVMEITVRI